MPALPVHEVQGDVIDRLDKVTPTIMWQGVRDVRGENLILGMDACLAARRLHVCWTVQTVPEISISSVSMIRLRLISLVPA